MITLEVQSRIPWSSGNGMYEVKHAQVRRKSRLHGKWLILSCTYSHSLSTSATDFSSTIGCTGSSHNRAISSLYPGTSVEISLDSGLIENRKTYQLSGKESKQDAHIC